MLEVCSGVTNEKEKDGRYKRSDRTPVERAESDRSSAMNEVFKRVLEVRIWRFCGCELVNLIDLMSLEALELTWLN